MNFGKEKWYRVLYSYWKYIWGMTEMELLELIKELDINLGSVTVFLVILLSIIQISPIKINPWSRIGNAIGGSFKKSIVDTVGDKIEEKMNGIEERVTNIEGKVDSIQSDINSLENRVVSMEAGMKMDQAVTYRVRILRFCDELQADRKHSKDSFDQVMSDITGYTKYCEENPDFKNHQTETTIEYIKRVYEERLEKRDFV